MSEEIKTTPTEEPAITVADDVTTALSIESDRFAELDITKDISSKSTAYCSLTAEDNRARVTLYNACSNPLKISDMINKQIKLFHVYIEKIQCTSEATGEIVTVPRVILIDEKGKGYQAVSTGIYNAVKRIIQLFGDPANWDAPHTVEVKNVPLAGGQHTFNLEVID